MDPAGPEFDVDPESYPLYTPSPPTHTPQPPPVRPLGSPTLGVGRCWKGFGVRIRVEVVDVADVEIIGWPAAVGVNQPGWIVHLEPGHRRAGVHITVDAARHVLKPTKTPKKQRKRVGISTCCVAPYRAQCVSVRSKSGQRQGRCGLLCNGRLCRCGWVYVCACVRACVRFSAEPVHLLVGKSSNPGVRKSKGKKASKKGIKNKVKKGGRCFHSTTVLPSSRNPHPGTSTDNSPPAR